MPFAKPQRLPFGVTNIYAAPNIYAATDEQRRTLGAERMDICAFVGVSPRGPCRIPIEPEAAQAKVYLEQKRRRSHAVAVESWDDFRRIFGGFEGPGRLPYAVASYFEQGGQKAYITRIVHQYSSEEENLAAMASAKLAGFTSPESIVLQAKNEGAWGNKLRAAIGYQARPLAMLANSDLSELEVHRDERLPPGTLLRLTLQTAESQAYVFRFVSGCSLRGQNQLSQQQAYLRLDKPLDSPALAAEIVEAEMLVDDGAGWREYHASLGLSPAHPRWLALVLYRESGLINPHSDWVEQSLTPSHAEIVPRAARDNFAKLAIHFHGGLDRYEDIQNSDFFDSNWVPGNAEPGDGIYALTETTEFASLVVPDLYVPQALQEKIQREPALSLASAEFTTCFDLPVSEQAFTQASPSLPGLQLDPSNPLDLEQIIRLQQALVQLAESQRHFVVLLDVPPGLTQNQLLQWQARFNSSFSAAYFPWLFLDNQDDQRQGLILLNPAAVAAGIIARQEISLGIAHGPANALANNVVKVAENISPQRHDQLHPLGINIYLAQRDGVWLSAARTLSRGRPYRQLSVRRLIIMLQKVLLRQMQWTVFEPNTPALWRQLRHMLTNFLRQLFIAGAFKGQSEEQAFFVRCDADLNHQRVIDAGQLIVEIGVAPAEPMEFIVVKIVRGGDGTLAAES